MIEKFTIEEIIKSEVENYFEEMIEIRRHLHKNPEVSFKEENTAKFIENYLKDIGISNIKTKVGLHGIVATIEVPKAKNSLAFRADFDALPINDLKNIKYKSTIPNVMHACGHDGHTATLLITCKILMKHLDKLENNIVAIFQYGEEQAPGGAKPMIDAGALTNVDAIFGTHLWTPLPLGTLGYSYKELCAAADRFEVIIEDTDAALIAAQFISMAQQIVSRFATPKETLVVTIGKFQMRNNKAIISGTIRNFDKNLHTLTLEKLQKLSESLKLEYPTSTVEFIYHGGYPALINNKKATLEILNASKKILPNEKLVEVEPLMIGEDFAYYTENIPGAFFLIGAGNNTFAKYPHHHPMFNFEESVMKSAAAIFLYLAFNSKEVIANLTEEKKNEHL